MESPKDKKSRINSKGKGNGYEGFVAKKLSTTLAPLNFMRSAGSGARLGGKNFAKFGEAFGEEAARLFVSDVVPINEKKVGLTFLHSIECKSYATADGFVALIAGTANIFRWFEESVEDAKKVDKNPILIVKWNRTPSYAIVDHDHPRYPKSDLHLPAPCTTIHSFNTAQPRTLEVYELDELLLVPSFWCSPSVIE